MNSWIIDLIPQYYKYLHIFAEGKFDIHVSFSLKHAGVIVYLPQVLMSLPSKNIARVLSFIVSRLCKNVLLGYVVF